RCGSSGRLDQDTQWTSTPAPPSLREVESAWTLPYWPLQSLSTFQASAKPQHSLDEAFDRSAAWTPNRRALVARRGGYAQPNRAERGRSHSGRASSPAGRHRRAGGARTRTDPFVDGGRRPFRHRGRNAGADGPAHRGQRARKGRPGAHELARDG